MVDGAVDYFFNAGGNTAEAVKDGFKVCIVYKAKNIADHAQGVVKTALNDFLGNVGAGEKSEEKFFIYMVHNTIVRVDIKVLNCTIMSRFST